MNAKKEPNKLPGGDSLMPLVMPPLNGGCNGTLVDDPPPMCG
jgi:hypothetical protein